MRIRNIGRGEIQAAEGRHGGQVHLLRLRADEGSRVQEYPYLREEEPTEQLIQLLDRIDINQMGVQLKFEEELKRHNKFNRGVLEVQKMTKTHTEIDLRTYAKYILKEGTNEEKRELMGCFKSRIKLTRTVATVEE